MSIATFKTTVIAIIATIIVAFAAITVGEVEAAQRGYLADGPARSALHRGDLSVEKLDIPFGDSEAEDYKAPEAKGKSIFTTFLDVVASMLPNTAAPHGAVTCTVADGHGGTYTVTRDTCADL